MAARPSMRSLAQGIGRALRYLILPLSLLLRLLRGLAGLVFDAGRHDAAGAIEPALLNGYLNGHQGFRFVWILLLFFSGPMMLGNPPINIQLVVGVALLIVGVLVTETACRKRIVITSKPFFNTVEIPSLDEHTAVTNLKVEHYPLHPFLLDFVALMLVIWGTGGTASPFQQLLFFGSFAASFALHNPRRSGLAALMAAAAYAVGVLLPALRPTMLPPSKALMFRVGFYDVQGLTIARGFAYGSGVGDEGGKLWLLTIVTVLFFVLSGTMAGRASQAYNKSLAATASPARQASPTKKEPDLGGRPSGGVTGAPPSGL